MQEVIGWILMVWGIGGAIHALATDPSLLLWESPILALLIIGGWLLIRKKRKKEE